jgi:hypothetical protein
VSVSARLPLLGDLLQPSLHSFCVSLLKFTSASSRHQVYSNSRQQTADSRQQTVGSRQEKADSREQTAGSRQQAADSRQQTAGSRQQTTGRTVLSGLLYTTLVLMMSRGKAEAVTVTGPGPE